MLASILKPACFSPRLSRWSENLGTSPSSCSRYITWVTRQWSRVTTLQPALSCMSRLLPLNESMGDSYSMAYTLIDLAEITIKEQNYEDADKLLEESSKYPDEKSPTNWVWASA